MHSCVGMGYNLSEMETSRLILISFEFIVNALIPRQNGHHFADGILRLIFGDENFWILNKIDYMAACSDPSHYLNQCWPSLLTHMWCVTRPQCVNTAKFHWTHYFPVNPLTICTVAFINDTYVQTRCFSYFDWLPYFVQVVPLQSVE